MPYGPVRVEISAGRTLRFRGDGQAIVDRYHLWNIAFGFALRIFPMPGNDRPIGTQRRSGKVVEEDDLGAVPENRSGASGEIPYRWSSSQAAKSANSAALGLGWRSLQLASRKARVPLLVPRIAIQYGVPATTFVAGRAMGFQAPATAAACCFPGSARRLDVRRHPHTIPPPTGTRSRWNPGRGQGIARCRWQWPSPGRPRLVPRGWSQPGFPRSGSPRSTVPEAAVVTFTVAEADWVVSATLVAVTV